MAEATKEAVHHTAVTKDNFDKEVTQFPGVVLIDFWATWCGPCRAMAPRIDEVARKYAGNPMVKVVEIDVDQESELSGEHQVLSIPTFKAFANGAFVDQRIGLIPGAELEKLIEAGLSKVAAK